MYILLIFCTFITNHDALALTALDLIEKVARFPKENFDRDKQLKSLSISVLPVFLVSRLFCVKIELMMRMHDETRVILIVITIFVSSYFSIIKSVLLMFQIKYHFLLMLLKMSRKTNDTRFLLLFFSTHNSFNAAT